jgi:hypothetical protein
MLENFICEHADYCKSALQRFLNVCLRQFLFARPAHADDKPGADAGVSSLLQNGKAQVPVRLW